MKIDFYHACFYNYATRSFIDSVKKQIPQLIADKYSKKVYKIQFYTDFYSKENGYLFIDGEYSYYPLTVIFPNRKWEVSWMRWKTTPPFEIHGQHVVYPALLPEEGVTYEMCEEIPKRFEEYIKGKNLYGAQPNNTPTACVKYHYNPGELGMYSQSFADAVRTKVYKQLLQLTGKELTSWWEISVNTLTPVVKVDGVSYLAVGVGNRFAEICYIGIGWKEDIGTDDFISTDDVDFQIVDKIPGVYTDGIDKTVEFIKVGTF